VGNSSITSSINLSSLGLGSGINDASIISQLVAIQQEPLTQLQTQVSNLTSASQTITQFASLMSTLQSATQALSDPTHYASYTASSSSSAVVASTTSSAQPGSYDVSVSRLAQSQITFSTPQSSSTAGLGFTGTLGITSGTSSASIAVQPGDSLATIASEISSSGLPLSASVVFDGTNYRIEVQGTNTGAAGAFSFNESGFSLLSPTTNPSNTYQVAQDANATVDGNAVTSATNQITGAIPGVTLALTGITPSTGGSSSPATVTIASNPSSIASNVQAFVTAYNNVVSAGHADAGYGSTAASNSILSGDNGIEASLNQLSTLVTSSVTGADANYQDLSSVGVTFNADGTLSFNSSTFEAAAAQDPSGVEKLFVTDPTTGATGIMQTISNAINTLSSGSTSFLQSEITSYQGRISNIQTNETAMQARITQYQTTMQQEFDAMDATVNEERSLFGQVGGTGSFV
jgi:flagellar hook-associated protein 2